MKKMKSIFAAALALILCFSLGLSVRAAGMYTGVTEEEAISVAKEMVTAISEIMENGERDLYEDGGMISEAFASWETAMEKMGSFQGFSGNDSAVIEDESMSITVGIQGEGRTGTVTVQMDEMGYSSIRVEADETRAEQIEHAALNTVLGLGMAFFVLSLIALIIKFFFPPINRLSESLANRGKKEVKAAPAPAPVQTAKTAPVAETAEENDPALIAVIAAAIAAAEGKAGTDGFVVRSIRRTRGGR